MGKRNDQVAKKGPEWEAVDDHTDIQVMSMDASTLAQLNRSELDQSIESAHKHVRSIQVFKDELLEMVTSDWETADECLYSLPRAGGFIEGPSVRFAEMAATAWGNMRYGARPVETNRDYVEVQGFAHDLQKNVACLLVVRRRVLGKRDADMIQLALAAGTSIAKRNAILSVIPRALCKVALAAADKCATEKGGSMDEQRELAVGGFRGLGAKDEQVFAALDVAGQADITGRHIRTLRGLYRAIKEKTLTLEEALRTPSEREAATRHRGALASSTIGEVLGTSTKPQRGHSQAPVAGEMHHDETAGDGDPTDKQAP
jgi:hypothetical protein